TVGRRRVWHAIIALGQHTRSNDVGRGMVPWPCGTTHDRTTSRVECHHNPLTAYTVGLCQVGYDMISARLDNTHGRTTSGLACSHGPWVTHTVGQHWAWHAIIALGLHTQSDDIKHGMPAWDMGTTHSWIM
ncbi:hypothetical protein EJD97_020814, partial [Solanum chilense]